MPAEEEQRLQSSNKCRYCHVTGKYRGSAHWSCNIKLTKNFPVIFHNLKGYDSHLIMQDKFDVKVNVIPLDQKNK